jgi:hypothetical protein
VKEEVAILSTDERECNHGKFANFEGLLKGELLKVVLQQKGIRSLQQ